MARETREEVRPKLRPGEVLGRDGTIKRRNKDLEDPYNVPEHLKEPGWSYQWNRMTCFNSMDQMEISRMMNNGWEYVSPTSRLGEIYGVNDAGHIEIGGLVLMERRQELTDEAIEETRMKTAELYGALMDKSSDLAVPKGYESRGKIVKRTGREAIRADALQTIPDE